MATRNIVPRGNEEGNLGTSLKNWLKGWFKNLFVSNEITNGSESVTIIDLDDAVSKKHPQTQLGTKNIDETDIANGKGVVYDLATDSLKYVDTGIGDMTKAVYDSDDDGIVDKSEVLNDGSSGGGNEVTALEVRDHIDDTTNPHSTNKNNIVIPRVTVNDTDFTILNTHHLISVITLTASRTLTLPNPDGMVREFIVNDESGKGGFYPITLQPPGAVTICGLSSIDINITCGTMWFYSDGTNYFIHSEPSNVGQVKINTGNSVKPSFTFTSGNLDVLQHIIYASALGISSYPTSKWPKNIDTPSDSDIYDFTNDTFIENTVPGQIQKWRVIISYSGKADNKPCGVTIKLSNTLSGFILQDIISIPVLSQSGSFQAVVTTIADDVSLPSPFGTGQGYIFEISSDSEIALTIESVTRISSKAD